tara:strand:- start:15107 stop:15778 length:672 start_codon:yes stop_codon:yes gene_type:complete
MIKVYINGLSGKMGNTLSALINSNSSNDKFILSDKIIDSNVVIDFSNPKSSMEVIEKCKKNSKPIIIGTTGFVKEEIQLINKISKNIAILLLSNMSQGITNLKISISSFLKNNNEKIKCIIKEIHHKDKIDSPSGTAIDLKKFILDCDTKNMIYFEKIISERIEDFYGIHEVVFKNEINEFVFKHEALSRDSFAMGSLNSASKILDLKPGLYKYDDYLHINNF